MGSATTIGDSLSGSDGLSGFVQSTDPGFRKWANLAVSMVIDTIGSQADTVCLA